jgi:hypothetical protein
MKKKVRFEIVRRGDRYYWLFVARKRGRRRVLARSARDFRSPENAMEAIDDLRNADCVLDTTGDPFQLPATSFHIVSGVAPLIVSQFLVEDSSAAELQAIGRPRNGPPATPAAAMAAAGTPAMAAAAPAATTPAPSTPATPAPAKRATKPAAAKSAAKPAASHSGRRTPRRPKKAPAS